MNEIKSSETDRSEFSNPTPIYQIQNDKTLMPYWRERACAIACLYMAIKTLQPKQKTSIKNLLDQVYYMGGYDKNTDTGWYHKSIVKIAEDLGLKAIIHKNAGFNSQIKVLKKGRYVMSSLISLNGGHIVLIYACGFHKNRNFGIYYNDPASSGGKNKFMTKNDFEKISKNQAISICTN